MSKTIALIDFFYLTEERIDRIRKTAESGGYELRYFSSTEDAKGKVADCEILFGHVRRNTIREAKEARWICAGRVGVNSICDPSLYARKDAVLTNSPGVYAVSIAEHLVMVSLMLLRKQYLYAGPMKRGEWGPEPRKISSLKNCRITVLGAGHIGTAFARRTASFEPAVIIGVRRSRTGSDPAFDRIILEKDLDKVLPETDLLVMCLPGVDGTKGILSRERLALLPETSFVINIGRGGCIDQEAMVEALEQNKLAGAALDVMTPEPLPADHPLRKFDNVILTPHIAGIPNLDYSADLIVDGFCEDLERYIKSIPLKNVIDIAKGY